MVFKGNSVWVRDLHKLEDIGLHFACTGSVRYAGDKYYIVQGYHDIGDRLMETSLVEGDDWMRVPRS